MTLKELLKKIVKKEQLSEAELELISKELDKANPEDNDKIKEITKERDDFKKQIDELESAKLSDIEKLQKQIKSMEDKAKVYDSQISSLTQEKEASINELATFKRKNSISQLSSKHKFEDSDYLDLLLNQKAIDLSKETDVNSFMEQLKKDKPKLFAVEGVKPGVQVVPPTPKDHTVDNAPKTRLTSVLDAIKSAPITQEN